MTDRLLPVSGIGLNGVAASRLERNTIVSSGKAGFSVANGTNLLIVANRVESAQNEGIELRGFCERLNVLGNTIRNAGRGGISGRYLPTTVRNSLFEGNEILESSADGMKVPLAENAVFAGNFVVRIDGRGVLIQEGTGNFVQRNQIFGCRLEGISTGCAESIGWGNQIKGCSLAISDTAGTNNCWIGNIVSGNAKDIILSSGVVMDWFALANRR
jgi:hypothetical protein